MKIKGPVMIAILSAAFAVAQAPDNTKTNQRDRGDSAAVTADQQKMSKEDTELARKIRESVYADKTLSTYAHNVKIVVQNGKVTLRGPVRSQEEKDQIQQKAESVAGADNVTNQIDIAPKKS
jgi:hyperosmotically inducible protein